jgi:hypothetical protein
MALSITEFIRRTEALAAVLRTDEVGDRVSIVALNRLAGLHKRRIFVDGKTTDGGKIGKYSTRPYYVNSNPKKQSRPSVQTSGLLKPPPKPVQLLPKSRLKPLGKNKRSKFKNGKLKKTRYLPGGYKEFRDRVGRQSDKVDLNLTSATVGSLQIGRKGHRYIYGYTNRRAADIMRGNEKRFNKQIDKVSAAEISALSEAALKEWTTILTEAYNKK